MKKILIRGAQLVASSLVVILLVFLVGVRWPFTPPPAAERPDRLLIAGADVVDVRSGDVLPRHDILIAGGEIVAVGQNLADRDARVIDGRGRFAIPGLFDMHTHAIKMAPFLMHPLYVAAGVTAVRDMGGCIGIEDPWIACADEKRAWNRAVIAGEMIGPRYDQITGLAINGGSEIPAQLDRSLGAGTPEGARQRVALASTRGLDFLKPYNRVPREGYFALAKAAQQSGLYLAGHLPLAVSALEAARAGQRSVEHGFLFMWDCYPGMAELREAGDIRRVFSSESRRRMLDEHDVSLCAQLHAQMMQSGMAFVPTHTTRKLDAYAMDEAYRNDSRLRFIPGPLRMLWLEDADSMAARGGADGEEMYLATYRFGIEQTGVAHAAGVTVLAGTDAPDSFAFPGSGLHDELGHFVEAGLTPLSALRSATLEPARFLGLEGSAGEIARGARADIVLLRANPLTDIQAVREVETVVLAGTPYLRADLDALEDGVEQAASSWTMWPKFTWQLLRSPIMRKQFAD